MTYKSYEGTPAYLAGYRDALRELGDVVAGVAGRALKDLDGDVESEPAGGEKIKATATVPDDVIKEKPEIWAAFCTLATVLDMITAQIEKKITATAPAKGAKQ